MRSKYLRSRGPLPVLAIEPFPFRYLPRTLIFVGRRERQYQRIVYGWFFRLGPGRRKELGNIRYSRSSISFIEFVQFDGDICAFSIGHLLTSLRRQTAKAN